MKHLLLCFVSFLHHTEPAKPALNARMLNRAVAHLTLAEPGKVICVYPVSGN